MQQNYSTSTLLGHQRSLALKLELSTVATPQAETKNSQLRYSVSKSLHYTAALVLMHKMPSSMLVVPLFFVILQYQKKPHGGVKWDTCGVKWDAHVQG
jgi:hypothetical protein